MTPEPIRVAILADYPEEGWPSMEQFAEILVTYHNSRHPEEVRATRVCPPFRHRLGRLPGSGTTGRNVDRILNRHRDYPRYLRRVVRGGSFDVYHVTDHSYAQLVHALPPGRAVVTCHDLDTFRCLLRPDLEPRPAWFRSLARRTLSGLGRAAFVPCASEATESAVLAHKLADPGRVRRIHNGINPEFLTPPDPAGEAEARRLVGPVGPDSPPLLLHVGSNIPRKRIDVLLATLAGVRRSIPGVRLAKVGGELTPAQADLARELGVLDAIRVVPLVADRSLLAAIYRLASLVLQPSEAEGFGLPLVEAMACGAPLLVSDIPVFREVAGESAVYRPVGDVVGWAEAATALLRERVDRPEALAARREAGLARSVAFRWEAHVDALLPLYREVAATAFPGAGGRPRR